MAQDISGKELAVGQTVAYCVAGKAQAMRLSTVTFVRKKTVELADKPFEGSCWGTRRNHAAVCIVN
jgi:hypothetical protein